MRMAANLSLFRAKFIATLWAAQRAQRRQIGDADLLIAVFDTNRNAILVTDNSKDFSGLNLNLENWR